MYICSNVYECVVVGLLADVQQTNKLLYEITKCQRIPTNSGYPLIPNAIVCYVTLGSNAARDPSLVPTGNTKRDSPRHVQRVLLFKKLFLLIAFHWASVSIRLEDRTRPESAIHISVCVRYSRSKLRRFDGESRFFFMNNYPHIAPAASTALQIGGDLVCVCVLHNLAQLLCSVFN